MPGQANRTPANAPARPRGRGRRARPHNGAAPGLLGTPRPGTSSFAGRQVSWLSGQRRTAAFPVQGTSGSGASNSPITVAGAATASAVSTVLSFPFHPDRPCREPLSHPKCKRWPTGIGPTDRRFGYIQSRPMKRATVPAMHRRLAWLALWIVVWSSLAPGIAQIALRASNAVGPGIEICTSTGVVQWGDAPSNSNPAAAASPQCDWCRLDGHWALPCHAVDTPLLPPSPTVLGIAWDIGSWPWGRWERPAVRGPPR